MDPLIGLRQDNETLVHLVEEGKVFQHEFSHLAADGRDVGQWQGPDQAENKCFKYGEGCQYNLSGTSLDEVDIRLRTEQDHSGHYTSDNRLIAAFDHHDDEDIAHVVM